MTAIESLLNALKPLREQLVAHPVYARVDSVEALRIFMESHVFAVWDFMTLLKALQRELTCVDLPWVPRGDSLSRRLINEIVLGEESDEDGRGGYASHFELYLDAMREAGADLSAIEGFWGQLVAGQTVPDAFNAVAVPSETRDFVLWTWQTATSGSSVAIAAAFTLGREELIPEMFSALRGGLEDGPTRDWAGFRHYLQRHIDLDGDEHGPAALRLLSVLCGDDPHRWSEAESAARQSLEARKGLWDGVDRRVQSAALSSSST